MKKIVMAILVLLLLKNSMYAQSGKEYLRKMYDHNKDKWYRTFTFVQTTEFYRNDSLLRTATWYEAAHFPYDFRIDIDVPQKGNAVIYKKDSTYRFQNGLLRGVTAGTNPFTFVLGGMYCVPFQVVEEQMQKDGYDLTKAYTTQWNGRKTYVIGALQGDTASKQMWVDAKEFYTVRTMEIDGNTHIDARMSDHIKVGKGWSETKVVFYFNGKLRQVEKYANVKGDVELDDRIFDPTLFGKFHWMK